ncbi:hypothetical protein [Actinoplanes sp. NPDC049265]|uniref:hypothetical protein n=1 Tax=Actinoplanes sp. NPDC049265 TaxID=3363902 RepID=UPI00371430E9
MTNNDTPTPPQFTARALGELVLSRLTEIDRLNHRINSTYPNSPRDYRPADRERERTRVAELGANLGLYAQLADTAARAEHNDLLAQQANTRRRVDSDEF